MISQHDIGKLAYDVLKLHRELEPLIIREASRLSKYAVFYRYSKSKAAAEITMNQVNEALACVIWFFSISAIEVSLFRYLQM